MPDVHDTAARSVLNVHNANLKEGTLPSKARHKSEMLRQ